MSETSTFYRTSTDIPGFVAGQTLPKSSHACPNREAALLWLCHSRSEHIDSLLTLSASEWRKLLYWLDVSGLCLYFAHQVNEFGLQKALPHAINQRLQQNLLDNRARIASLLRESAAIQSGFRQANISYAVLKGFSLCPSSVLKPELRHQTDLDFLVADRHADQARRVVERAGYHLHAISGKTWEYKKDETLRFSTRDIYKDGFGYMVDLHVEAAQPTPESLLNRLEYREIEGITMPVLSSQELFLLQGRQILKDVCHPFLRASHLMELYRHVCARRDDAAFWSDVRSLAEKDPRGMIGLGIGFQLIESVMGGEIPSQLVTWTICRLPASVQRWLSLYGTRTVYGMPPGTKLYLLLRKEIEELGIYPPQPVKKDLVPTGLPPMIVSARPGEALTFRLGRYARQFRFIFRRLRFHVVEGMRYGWASYRWRANQAVTR